jgi:hypothetical protein
MSAPLNPLGTGAFDPNNPAVYGPVNGVFVTLSEFHAYEQSLVDQNARAAGALWDQLNQASGTDFPNPVTPPAAPAPLQSFTGDCSQPNRPGFPGWATFADAAAWANACTATHVNVPGIPATTPTTPAGSAAGRGAPAAVPIAGGSAAGSTPRLQSHASGFDPTGGPGSYCDEFPDDPLCDIWGGGGGIVFGGGSTGSVYQPVIIQEGLNATDVHGIVNGALDTVWSAVVGAIDATILVAIAAIQDAITALGNAIKAAFATLAKWGGKILKFLDKQFHRLMKDILQVLQDIRNWAKKEAKEIIPQLTKAVIAIRKRLLEFYQNYLRKLLIWMQNVRRVLNILAIFHVPFAQKLDAKLADLERRITAPFLLLLRYSNAVANWMNLIVTANYLFQKPMWLWSLNAYRGESINLLTNAMNTPASAAVKAKASTAFTLGDASQSKADLTQYLQTGTGTMAAPIASAQQTFDEFLVTQG